MTENPHAPFLGLDDFLKGALVHEAPIGVDTEGTGLNVLDGRDFSYGVSIAYRHPDLGLLKHYMPFRHNYGPNLDPQRLVQLRDILHQRRDEGRPITSHNLTYDLPALSTLGIDYYSGNSYCTLIGSQLVNENSPRYNKNLDNCGQKYLGYGKLKETTDGAWAYRNAVEIYNYAAHDAKMHYELGQVIVPMMDKEGLLDSVWPQKHRTLKVLDKMRRRGILIDQDLCAQQYELGVAIMQDIANT